MIGTATVACCSRETNLELLSPDGALVVRDTIKNCGATVGFITEVTLGSGPSSSASHTEEVVVRYEGGKPPVLRWVGPRELAIGLSDQARVAKKLDTWRDVKIVYGPG
jgi:hypothetical protein